MRVPDLVRYLLCQCGDRTLSSRIIARISSPDMCDTYLPVLCVRIMFACGIRLTFSYSWIEGGRGIDITPQAKGGKRKSSKRVYVGNTGNAICAPQAFTYSRAGKYFEAMEKLFGRDEVMTTNLSEQNWQGIALTSLRVSFISLSSTSCERVKSRCEHPT